MRTALLKRKGILATMMTVLFTLPFVILVMTASTNFKLTQTAYTVMEGGLKIRYCEEDISSDIIEILGWKSSIAGDGTAVFNISGIGTLGNDTLIVNFADFVSSVYAQKFNLVAHLSETIYPVNITPIGYSLTVDDQLSFRPFSGAPYSNFTQIGLVVGVNTNASLASNSTPANNGAIAVGVKIVDSNNNLIIEYPTWALDPVQNNAPFHAEFTDGSTVDVTFGVVNGTSGTLLVVPTNIAAQIVDLSGRYRTSAKPELYTSMQINLTVPGSLQKTSYVHS
jgi:hypothetical protein